MCVTVHVSLEQVYSVCYCACVIGAGIQCVLLCMWPLEQVYSVCDCACVIGAGIQCALLCMCHWSRYTVCVTVHVSLEQVYSVCDCACVIGAGIQCV